MYAPCERTELLFDPTNTNRQQQKKILDKIGAGKISA